MRDRCTADEDPEDEQPQRRRDARPERIRTMLALRRRRRAGRHARLSRGMDRRGPHERARRVGVDERELGADGLHAMESRFSLMRCNPRVIRVGASCPHLRSTMRNRGHMSRAAIWPLAPDADTTVGDIDEGRRGVRTGNRHRRRCRGRLRDATALAGAGARADGVIVGCQKPGKGFLRVVREASDCRRNERVITWNERGAAGPQGPAGPAGAQGAVGPRGRRVTRALPDDRACGSGGRSGLPALPGQRVQLGPRERRVLPVRRVRQERHPSERSTGRVHALRRCSRDARRRRDVGEPDRASLPRRRHLRRLLPPPPPTSTLVINEIDYDQVGADSDGFVEIANKGTSAATLDGIALVLVNGGDGTEYARVALTGSLAAGGYLGSTSRRRTALRTASRSSTPPRRRSWTPSPTRARSPRRRSTGRRTTSSRAPRLR